MTLSIITLRIMTLILRSDILIMIFLLLCWVSLCWMAFCWLSWRTVIIVKHCSYLFFDGSKGCHDIQHYDTQHNAILDNDTQHKGLVCDTQHKWHSTYLTLSITILCITLSVALLNVAFHFLKCWNPLCWMSLCWVSWCLLKRVYLHLPLITSVFNQRRYKIK